MYIGSWKIDDLLTFVVNTQVFATGVATDADAVPAYRVYEDETGTAILTGNMALLDSANTAGFYSEQITLSAANGFEKGKCYSIYISATVSSVAGATHRTFQIQAEVAVASYNTGQVPLQPTVAGRTLDVSAGGEAGLDWANIGSPTTAQNLSATNIDVDQVVASVSGAVGSVTGAVGSVTGNVGGNVTGSVGSIATGGIAAASFAAGAIDATAIATDAIGAAEFSQAAADKVWSTTTRQLTGTQTFNLTGNITGNLSGSVGSVTGAVGSVTGNVGGNVTGTIGGLTAGALADFFDTDSGKVYADAVAGSVVKEIADNAGGSPAAVAAAVWDEDATGHQTQGSFGQVLGDSGADTDSVWSLANTNLDAAVSSRLAPTVASRTLDVTATGAAGLDWGNVENQGTAVNLSSTNIDPDQVVASVTGAVGSVTGAVGSVTGNVGGNVTGSVGSVVGNVGGNVTGSVGSVVGSVGGNVTGSIGSLATQAKADVNAEVVDALSVDTYAEPTGVPAATTTLALKIGRLYQVLRNKIEITATAKTLSDDGGSALWKKPLADDGTTYTESEGTTP